MKFYYLLLFGIIIFFQSCDNEQETEQEKYFMTAEINGVEWECESGRAWFQLDYRHDLGYHATHIYSDSDIPLNGIYYHISIGHRYYPQLGKIYFNATKDEVPYENGAYAVLSGWLDKNKDNYYNTLSTNGFVEITEINRYSMKGIFEFESSSYYHPEYGKYIVRNGQFFVPLTLVSGASWDGNYKK
jgi:hypothetical protein